MRPPEGAHQSRPMAVDGTSKPVEPRTLAEAYYAVAGIRPRQKAPLSEWLAYHQRCAGWYAEIAEIDRGHHHEALFMAEQERQRIKEIKAEISVERAASEG